MVIAGQLQFDWLGGTLAAVMRTDPTAEGGGLGLAAGRPAGARAAAAGHCRGGANWRDAGKIGYALGPDVTMLCLSTDSRQFGFAHPLRDYAGRDVLCWRSIPMARRQAAWFRAVETLAPSSVRLDGRVLRTVTVLRGHGLRAER